jgi:transformer-2 protein
MSGDWERDGAGMFPICGVSKADVVESGYENGNGASRDWERDGPHRSQSPRSRSPRRDRSPRRYVSLSSHLTSREDRLPKEVENPGSNLFVSGVAPRMKEDELEELFSKYGRVDKVQIMLDPHTNESRGFGFVQMNTAEEADAAKEGLTGEERYGRVLTIEKARRGRARTPTPGKYFGPPKRKCTSRRTKLIEPGDGPPPRRGGYGRDDRGYGRDRGYDRGYDDRYDGRGGGGRRDYGGDSYDRYERPRYDDRYAPPSRGNYNSNSRREDYYYDSRR